MDVGELSVTKVRKELKQLFVLNWDFLKEVYSTQSSSSKYCPTYVHIII